MVAEKEIRDQTSSKRIVNKDTIFVQQHNEILQLKSVAKVKFLYDNVEQELHFNIKCTMKEIIYEHSRLTYVKVKEGQHYAVQLMQIGKG